MNNSPKDFQGLRLWIRDVSLILVIWTHAALELGSGLPCTIVIFGYPSQC